MRPRAPAAALLAGLILGACTVQTPSVAPSSAPAPAAETGPRTVAYRCDGNGNMTARFQDGAVRLFLPGRSVLMRPAVSASGARYTAPTGEFWDKGGEARLTLDGRVRRCMAAETLDPWAEAKLSGVSFRALGHEPEWLLEVRPGEVTLRHGVPPRIGRWPAEPPGHTARARVWTLSSPQGSLTVFATPRVCRDSMTGEAFSHAVTVMSPAGTVQGCGRDLD